MKEDKNLLVIPSDERVRLNGDGSITIFVDIPGGVIKETSMNVPKGQWRYKKLINEE